MMLMRFFCVFFFSDFLYKSICCGYSFELHQQVDAVQMGTHNICLYKEVDKKYTGCKTTELTPPSGSYNHAHVNFLRQTLY